MSPFSPMTNHFKPDGSPARTLDPAAYVSSSGATPVDSFYQFELNNAIQDRGALEDFERLLHERGWTESEALVKAIWMIRHNWNEEDSENEGGS